jgi:lambda family phage minor tail protein L
MTFSSEFQSLDVESPIDLVTLFGDGIPTTRICNTGTVGFGYLPDSSEIFYLGYPFDVTWTSKSSEGTEPQSRLIISDISGLVGERIDNFSGLIGSFVNVKRTLSMFLNDKPTADASQYIEFELRINTYAGAYSDSFEFTLIPSISLERKKLPGRQYLRLCQWQLGDQNCQAPITSSFDLQGNPTTFENRACRKDLDACNQYHGHTLRFGGFPGVTRDRG